MLFGCLEQCLVFTPLALGIFLSYYVLKITDLSVDGAFVLGAIIYALALKAGIPLFFALLLGTLAAGMVGLASGLLQNKEHIPPLLAGILVTYSLYSLNILVLGRPNQGLQDLAHLSDFFPDSLLAYLLIAAGSYIFLFALLKSRVGLCLRAFGCNRSLLGSFSGQEEYFRRGGLFISNSLAGLSGCMSADLSDYVDCGMGQGLVLVGIGTVVLGLQLLPKSIPSPLKKTQVAAILVFVGVAVYFLLFTALLQMGTNPFYLKLILASSLACFLYIRGRQGALRQRGVS